MADNTILNVGTGGDTIATDDLATLNGGAISGVKAQRIKVGFGSDTNFQDVDWHHGLPVRQDGTLLLSYDVGVAYDTSVWIAGGTNPPTNSSNGVSITLASGAAKQSYLASVGKFRVTTGSGPLHYSAGITLGDDTAPTNSREDARSWGLVKDNGFLDAATLEGAFFSIGLGLVLSCFVIRGSMLVQKNIPRTTDGLRHQYEIIYDGLTALFLRDGLVMTEVTPADYGSLTSTNLYSDYQAVQIQTTPGGALGSYTHFSYGSISVRDLSRSNFQLSDGVYPHRKVQVSKNGGLSVKGTSIPGVSTSIAAAGTGTIGPVDVSEAGNVTFVVKNTVAASAYAGNPVLVFEQSDDNVSWGPLIVVRADTGAQGSTVTLAPNVANVSLMFDAGIEGVSWVRVRVTTGPVTNALTVAIVVGGMPFSPSVATLDKKDIGRNQVNFFMTVPVLTTVTDALMSLTGYKSGAAVGAVTAPAVVSAGKTLRIVSATLTYVATATAGTAKFTLRANTAGVVVLASPAVQVWIAGGQAVVAGVSQTVSIPIPDGFEFAAGTGIGISMVGLSPTQVAAIAGYGQISLHGFEY
jgi:hypothetical protein